MSGRNGTFMKPARKVGTNKECIITSIRANNLFKVSYGLDRVQGAVMNLSMNDFRRIQKRFQIKS